MMPIRTLDELKNNWDIFENQDREYNLFLLYSQPHRNIIQFIRESFYDLDRMSGHECFIFLIEQPPTDWKNVTRQREYWQQFQFRREVDEYLNEVTPYQRSEVFTIARHFNIANAEIPCLVIFKNITDKEVFVYKLDNSWTFERLTREFQKVFDILRDKKLTIARTQLEVLNVANTLDNFIRKVLTHPISEIFTKIFKWASSDEKK